MHRIAILPVVVSLSLLSCKPKPGDEEPSPLLDVEQTASWNLPELELSADAYVMRTEMGVPHVYAATREDLGKVLGFTVARDRFFYMDLARRFSLGSLAALLGRDALENDIETRMSGATFIADRIVELLDTDPEMKTFFEAYAAGINAYIEQVRAGALPPPSEYDIAFQLLGRSEPVALMEPFTLRDVAAGVTTVLYESGFETKDIGRTADAARLETLFDGAPEETLRKAGVLTDVWDRTEPVHEVASAPDWTFPRSNAAPNATPRMPRVAVPPEILERLRHHLDRIEDRLGHDWVEGFGSNAWAVSGDSSADGRALIASDGHLPLSIPPLFFQVGLDTRHLGGDEAGLMQVGMITPAMPLMSTGTNGDVAFGQTQLIGDITDWYSEEVVLDGDGAPTATIFDGSEVALTAVSESFDIASVPLLGSQAGTETIVRYVTADGRWITSVEGRRVGGPDEAAEGETAINLMGDWVIPADTDEDGVISGISFAYAGLQLSAMPSVIDRYTRAKTVEAFKEATSDLVAYSLNLVAADRTGSILYTGFQATPCRDYLPRNPDGSWVEGANPNMLIDGTTYPSFEIPIDETGRVIFGETDPTRCIIDYDSVPHAFDPDQGYVVTGNNDPGGMSFDGALYDDPVYIGGPWQEGYRPEQIAARLEEAIADGGATLDDMKDVQADHTSTIGKQLVPVLLEALDEIASASASDGKLTASMARAVALYDDNAGRVDEAASRLQAWLDRGLQAESGVETFYESPTSEEVTDSVATTIFNAWMGRYVDRTVGDEGFPGLGFPTGDSGRFRVLTRMLRYRGADAPADHGSWNPETQESIYFDDIRTEPIETSTEVALLALVDALDWLEGPYEGDGQGGFGTDDMDAWLWGLRHWVTFTSLLADFFGVDDPLLGPLIDPLNINTNTFPVAEGLSSTDPRADLPGFPRHGDHLGVDALNSGTNGRSFDNDYGSVFRMVVALGEGGFEAYNILPGGQSGLTDSENFSDQARLWLGNEYLPVPLGAAAVAELAVGRETFRAPKAPEESE